jgi:hypothetical protein
MRRWRWVQGALPRSGTAVRHVSASHCELLESGAAVGATEVLQVDRALGEIDAGARRCSRRKDGLLRRR